MIEIWSDIPDSSGYQVSTLGNVRNLNFNQQKGVVKNLKAIPDKDGYLRVNIKGKQWSIHRLVATVFLLNPTNKEQVNHLNEVKCDNRLINLVWTTASENSNHGTRNAKISKNKKGIVFSEKHKNKLSKAKLGNKNAIGKHNYRKLVN